MKKNIKNLVLAASSAMILAGGVTGCSGVYDDSEIWNKLNGIDSDIESIKTDIEALKSKIDGLNTTYKALTSLFNGGLITNITETTGPNGETGYTFTVQTVVDPTATPVKTETATYTIWNGTNGQPGAAGTTPVLGAAQDENGRYYWTVTVDGQTNPLLDEQGGKIYTDGLTPQVKIEETETEGMIEWFVGYDRNGNGAIDEEEWTSLGSFSGDVVGNSKIDATVTDGNMTITIGENAYTFPLQKVLGIEFSTDVTNGVHLLAGEEIQIGFTLTGASEKAVVKAELLNEGNFTVKTADNIITIASTGEYGDEACVLVHVYENGQSCYHTSFTVAADLTSLTKLELTEAAFTSPYTEPGDGIGIPGLCDGDEQTFWHSLWTRVDLTTDDWGIYIDIDLGVEKTEVAFKYVTRYTNGNAVPKVLKIGVSNDGENWTAVGTVDSGLPTNKNEWWDGLNKRFSNGETAFRYVRFGITTSAQGELTNLESLSGKSTALGELEVYAN